MSLKRLKLSILAGILLVLSQGSYAELTIEITKGQGEAVPIAIVPFGWNGQGAKPYGVAEVVSSDMARTGRFAPVAESDMLQKPTIKLLGLQGGFFACRIVAIVFEAKRDALLTHRYQTRIGDRNPMCISR